MRLFTILLTAGLAAAFAQEQPAPAKAKGRGGAVAELKNAEGESVGTIRATPMRGGSGIRLVGELSNLPPGEHGFHIHMTGKCDPPDFTTAGAHFNPGGHKHGLASKGGHEGDLGNITVDQSGKVKISVTTTGVTLGNEPNSLLKEGGTAVMVHANADDLKSDPAGNAGARIACGVFARP